MDALQQLWAGSGLAQMTLAQGLMIVIGLLLLYLAIVRKFEPLLLVTIGFGGILSNIPGSKSPLAMACCTWFTWSVSKPEPSR